MKGSLFIFSSPPNSERTARGLRLSRELAEEARSVTFVMTQDSVFLAVKNLSHSNSALGKVSEAYVLDEHLIRRGFSAEDLRPPFRAVSYDGLVDLIMQDEASVLGSF